MEKFIEIVVLKNKEQGFFYPAVRFHKEAEGVILSYSVLARAMVCIAEIGLNGVPEQKLKESEEALMREFSLYWKEKNKHIENL